MLYREKALRHEPAEAAGIAEYFQRLGVKIGNNVFTRLDRVSPRIVFVTGRGRAGFHFVTLPLLRPGVNSLPFLPAPYDTEPWPGYGPGRVFYFPR